MDARQACAGLQLGAAPQSGADGSQEQPADAAVQRLIGAGASKLGSVTLKGLNIPELDAKEVMCNIHYCQSYCSGGQARVYFTDWREAPEGNTGTIVPGRPVAIKMVLNHSGGRQFVDHFKSKEELEAANARGCRGLRIELHLLNILHNGGCGDRVVWPIARTSWAGEWHADPTVRASRWHKPLHAYVMPHYKRGSVTQLLRDVCSRRLREADARPFMSQSWLSREFHVLLGELHKIHTAPGVSLMMQDLTANNLLVDDTGAKPRLLFADPAMAQPIGLLHVDSLSWRRPLVATWLWGSMRARNGRFDPKADLYSLSFIFAEMWLVAEGSMNPAADIILLLGLQQPLSRGVAFMRHLICQVVRLQYHGGAVVPRAEKHHLPVSWLGAWAILLGFRDHPGGPGVFEPSHLHRLPCLRPGEGEMLEVARLWARVAEAAEALPEALSAEEAQGAGCAALVGDMCSLHTLLTQLSHLDDAGEQQDEALAWLAANFMAQQHPLVDAMREQGAKGVGAPEKQNRMSYATLDWQSAVQIAEQRVLRGSASAVAAQRAPSDKAQELQQDHQTALRALQELGQWYQRIQSSLPPEHLVPPHLAAHLGVPAPPVGRPAQPPASPVPPVASPGPAAAAAHAATQHEPADLFAGGRASGTSAELPNEQDLGMAALDRLAAFVACPLQPAADAEVLGQKRKSCAQAASAELAALPEAVVDGIAQLLEAADDAPNQRAMQALAATASLRAAAVPSLAAREGSPSKRLALPRGGPAGVKGPSAGWPACSPAMHPLGLAAASCGEGLASPRGFTAAAPHAAAGAGAASLSPSKSFKDKTKGNTRYDKTSVALYSQSLHELIRTQQEPFHLLDTHERRKAFLLWWIGLADHPEIKGMSFSREAVSIYAMAVLNHARPGHGMMPKDPARAGQPSQGWKAAVATMPHAAAKLLEKM